MEATRYDFSPITKSEITDEGYLRVWSRTARTGVQVYHRADGRTVREYRPPEEVGNPESLATFGMKAVTWGHPPVLLDADNTKEYQIGHNGSQVRFTDGFVEVAHIITDAESIKKIQRGDAVEVSPGYRVDADDTPGVTPQGEPYDVVQRNIRVNHVAVVPRGRSGPEVRLLLDRMDSADAVAFEQQKPRPHVPMATVNLDGLTVDLPAEVAGAVQNFVQTSQNSIQALNQRIDALEGELEEVQGELQTTLDEKEAAEGRADALEAASEEREDSDGDGEGRFYVTQEELDELLVNRLQTLQHLEPAFGEDFKFDSLDDDHLYIQAFENITGEPPSDDLEMGYVRGVVDMAINQFHADAADPEPEEKEERTDSTNTLRNNLRNVKPAPSTHSQSRVDSEKRWMKPMTASKRR